MSDHPSEELSEHLLDYQAAVIKTAYKRRKTMVSLSNARHARLINDIWQAANIEHVEVVGARRWKKIGFSVSSACFTQLTVRCTLLLMEYLSDGDPTKGVWS
jgi:hypothetical protein